MTSRIRVALPALALAAAAVGCSAPTRSTLRRPTVQTLPDGTTVICQMERPTGSHLAERVCRRVDDVERARNEVQSELVRPRSTPPKGN